MWKVRLETRDKELVTYGHIPPFLENHTPEVIIWGSRTFTHGGKRVDQDGAVLVYREVFAVALVLTEPAKRDTQGNEITGP